MTFLYPKTVPSSNCLSSRSVEACYVQTEGHAEKFLKQLLPQLTPGEQERAGRFRCAKDRMAFALGRVLVRRTLSYYAALPPCGWEFVCNRYGKPDLRSSPGIPPFRFNLSHCEGIVAAAFTLDREIGADVESLDRRLADPGVAHYLAPEERNYLESLSDEQRPSAFLAVWTLKEAYIKARGMGLSIPLADFAFSLQPIRISFPLGIQDQPSNWFFWQRNLTASHVLALAVRRQPEEELAVSVHEVSLESLC